MKSAFMVFQVIASIILILSILLQSGKSAGLSGSIGGGAEQLLGKKKGRGYDQLLNKITTVGAIAFIVCALVLVTLE
ncbi:MAG: preprotein translocase subunit SecG [Peptostreptococcales bacterium]